MCPKMPILREKNENFSNFEATFPRSGNVANAACQVVSDSKFNVEQDALVHFVQKGRKMP